MEFSFHLLKMKTLDFFPLSLLVTLCYRITWVRYIYSSSIKFSCLTQGPAAPSKTLSRIIKSAEEIQEIYPNIRVQPAIIDVGDAATIAALIAFLTPQDEDANTVVAFRKQLTVKSYFKNYARQSHCCMAARADLKNCSGGL